MNNKRGDTSIWIIIALILGITFLVLVLTGTIDVWTPLKSLFQTSNVDTINLQCKTSCNLNYKYDFCVEPREVKIKGQASITGTCDSISKKRPDLIDKCSKFVCPATSGGGDTGGGNGGSSGEECKTHSECTKQWCVDGKCVDMPSPSEEELGEIQELYLDDKAVMSWYENSVAGELTNFVLKKHQENEITFTEYFLVIERDGEVIYKSNSYPLESGWNKEEIPKKLPLDLGVGTWVKFYFYLQDQKGKWYRFQNSLITLWNQESNKKDVDTLEKIFDILQSNGVETLSYDYNKNTWIQGNEMCACLGTPCTDYVEWIQKDSSGMEFKEPLLLLALLIEEGRCGHPYTTRDRVKAIALNLNSAAPEEYFTGEGYFYIHYQSQIDKCINLGVSRYKYYDGFNAALRIREGVECKTTDDGKLDAQASNLFYVEEVMYIYGRLLEMYEDASSSNLPPLQGI